MDEAVRETKETFDIRVPGVQVEVSKEEQIR